MLITDLVSSGTPYDTSIKGEWTATQLEHSITYGQPFYTMQFLVIGMNHTETRQERLLHTHLIN